MSGAHRSPVSSTPADGSIASFGSSGSIASALSAGSIASVLSAGSIASALSAGSIGSFASRGSVLSALSTRSVLSWRSTRSVLSAGATDAFLGRPYQPPTPGAVVRGAGRALVAVGTLGAVALTAHTVYNLRQLRRPPHDPPPVAERVSLLVPARDEAERIAPCIEALLAQQGLRDVEVLVLDDHSTDGTADVVRAVAGDDPRLRVIEGADLPDGWLGKPWACRQLADAATGSVLVFVDADVVVEPHGIAATVATLRWSGLDLVCPYPRQLAEGAAERLVQPLLQWSWLTTLPLALAETSARESLVAANGQLLAADAVAYRTVGGHDAVRDEVLDDVALLRAFKRNGFRGNVVDGTDVATCRMYIGWDDLRDGYTKSLWSAFGSPAGAAGATAVLSTVYVLPAAAALTGSPVGAVGYAAAVLGRVLVARRTGARVLPDSLAHPVSVGLFGALTFASWRRKRRGQLSWKGRAVSVDPAS